MKKMKKIVLIIVITWKDFKIFFIREYVFNKHEDETPCMYLTHMMFCYICLLRIIIRVVNLVHFFLLYPTHMGQKP